MTGGVRAWALVAIAALSVIAAILAQLIAPPGTYDPATATVFLLTVTSMAVVGAFLAIRVPGNRIGWLLLVAGSMLAAGLLSAAYTLGEHRRGRHVAVHGLHRLG